LLEEDAFTPLALLNIPKLNLNQRKINEKKTFTRLGQSDLSAVLISFDTLQGLPLIDIFKPI
jgi:hypothetical protein